MAAKGESDELPLVVSVCGTYLKKEMQSLYRQIISLQRHRNLVLAERIENAEMFPFEPVIQMEKLVRPRLRGNFILRFWYKYVVKQWPPPRPINKEVKPYYPYDMVDLIARHQPALVHVYYGHKAVKYLEMMRATGVPWVVSFHGVDVVKFIDEPGYAESLREVFREAQLVMARSGSLLDRLEELGCPKDKLRMNRTPIPLDGIESFERTPPRDGRWRLVQACRLIAKKGIFTLLDALPKVIEQWPDLKYCLAGVGPDRERIEAAVKERGLDRNVEMLGWLDQAGLQVEYAKAHAFLHPSELTETNDQEGVPNSMLEAMAAGLPVVATYHGGIPEAVTDGEDGYLVPERSADELAAAILKLLADEEQMRKLSKRAAESVRKNFGFGDQIANLESVYEEACVRAGESSP
ncbi:MAG: colanic acid/amylovoran biosynthesis glycosyltransferase [Verrucomicrobiales bacterium]